MDEAFGNFDTQIDNQNKKEQKINKKYETKTFVHSIVTQHNCNTNVNMNDCDETEPYLEENVCGDGYEGIPDYPSSHTLKIICGKTEINTVLDNSNDRTVCTMEFHKNCRLKRYYTMGPKHVKKLKSERGEESPVYLCSRLLLH